MSRQNLIIIIGGQEVEITSPEDFPLAISYKLEDKEDFQQKRASEAFSVTVPATLQNDKISNTFYNPSIEDLSTDEAYTNFRSASIVAGSMEVLVGKALLTSAEHTDRPVNYSYDLYGGNADWMIDLKEVTFFDLLKNLAFVFTKAQIEASWNFDGRDEALPYVFAPVRYGEPMAGYYANLVQVNPAIIPDVNMEPGYMKPALSKYWLIYWAFKSLGYRVQSAFFDSDYFRRQVMPWTWGNFQFSDGTELDNLKFLAKSAGGPYFQSTTQTGIFDFDVTNETTGGAFNNNGVYSYVAKTMKWTYPTAFSAFGLINATLHLSMPYQATVAAGGDVEMRAQWFKNGTRVYSHDDNGNGTTLVDFHHPGIGRDDFAGTAEDWFSADVNPGDTISCKIYLHLYGQNQSRGNITTRVETFELSYFRITMGSTVHLSNYKALKKYKFLDFLRGVVDEFNLSVGTNPAEKVVYFEPTHAYATGSNLSTQQPGYFNGNFLDWEDKQDLSKVSKIENYADGEREMLFKYRDDSNDGILKKVQDRSSAVASQGKFVLPTRFKAGEKIVKNRFFSPVMHYEVKQWEGITGTAPQMICLVPENVANTSADEAQNTFNPKSAYYKGLTAGVGGWKWDGLNQNTFPFMFAVNYKAGGDSDPVLSYSDELIGKGGSSVVAAGLLRRFYLQRMANMRGGKIYLTNFLLNNNDVANFLHREHIKLRGLRWELMEINNFRPLHDESTLCTLRKVVPIAQEDDTAIFPLHAAMLGTQTTPNPFDIKYVQLLGLPSDI